LLLPPDDRAARLTAMKDDYSSTGGNGPARLRLAEKLRIFAVLPFLFIFAMIAGIPFLVSGTVLAVLLPTSMAVVAIVTKALL